MKGVILKKPRPNLRAKPMRILGNKKRFPKRGNGYDVVTMSYVEDRIIADHNLAKRYFVSRAMLESNSFEVQPLTLSRLIGAVVMNFGRMSTVRFYRTLRKANMLDIEQGCGPRLKDIRWPGKGNR